MMIPFNGSCTPGGAPAFHLRQGEAPNESSAFKARITIVTYSMCIYIYRYIHIYIYMSIYILTVYDVYMFAEQMISSHCNCIYFVKIHRVVISSNLTCLT